MAGSKEPPKAPAEIAMFRATLAGGLELRPITETDAPAVFEAVERNREHLRRWLNWVDSNETLEDTRAFVDSAVDNYICDQALTAVIWDGDSVAGLIGTHKIDWLNRKCEIGYWLAEKYVGRGIMSAACRALIQHLFETCELHRIECLCATGNKRSCAIPERLGFTREGVQRQGLLLQGAYHDMYVWSLLREEWRG